MSEIALTMLDIVIHPLIIQIRRCTYVHTYFRIISFKLTQRLLAAYT